MGQPPDLFQTILNLSYYHREHEKFYAQEPLRQATELQRASAILKTYGERWFRVVPQGPGRSSPYAGCDDLNEGATVQHTGVLFMEGEGEPPEISRLKRDIPTLADDFEETGKWLSQAMQASWEAARPLTQEPLLASVLGERHRITVNDWQAANLSTLVATALRRALVVLERVTFSPQAIRSDLAAGRSYPDYLYSAAELIDHAADLVVSSAMLVHDNERRWRVFRQRVEQLTGDRSG